MMNARCDATDSDSQGRRASASRGFRRLGALLLCAALAACGGEDAAIVPKADPQYQAEIEQWRQLRREDLTRPDGWTSLVGLHWLTLKAHYAGSQRSGIKLMHGPPSLGMFSHQGERVFFTPEAGVALTLDGQPLGRGRIELYDDRKPVPSVLGFDDGKGQLTVIRRGDRHALRVKHADAATRTQFAGLDYFPIDSAWRIQAKFTPHPPGTAIPVVSILGHTENTPSPGTLEFQHDGRSFKIQTFHRGQDGLSILVADRTSGHDTFGQGRFVDLLAPDNTGNVTIDFNRAYNPPCAFTTFGTCPTPPADNRLDIAITAGEKRYRGQR
jgi:uncharacterized protein